MLFQPKYALLQMEVIGFSHTSVATQHLDTLSIHLWNSLLFWGGLLALSLFSVSFFSVLTLSVW